MSLELALQENTAALKALHATLASGASIAASTPAPAPAAEKPTKPAKETKPAADTAKAEAPAGPSWKETLDKIKEVNASTVAGAGKDGVVAIIKKFGKDGDKVPALEAIGKNAEIIAFANSLLTPADAGGDDLGI